MSTFEVEIKHTLTQSAIIDRLVERLFDEYDDDGDRNHGAINLKAKVNKAMEAEIQERVAAHIDTLLIASLEQLIQRTDGFGSPVGEPRTVASYVSERLSAYLSDRVDDSGRDKSHKDYREPYGKMAGTRMDYVVQKAVAAAVDNDIRRELDKAVKQIRESVKANVNAMVATAVGQLMGERR